MRIQIQSNQSKKRKQRKLNKAISRIIYISKCIMSIAFAFGVLSMLAVTNTTVLTVLVPFFLKFFHPH